MKNRAATCFAGPPLAVENAEVTKADGWALRCVLLEAGGKPPHRTLPDAVGAASSRRVSLPDLLQRLYYGSAEQPLSVAAAANNNNTAAAAAPVHSRRPLRPSPAARELRGRLRVQRSAAADTAAAAAAAAQQQQRHAATLPPPTTTAAHLATLAGLRSFLHPTAAWGDDDDGPASATAAAAAAGKTLAAAAATAPLPGAEARPGAAKRRRQSQAAATATTTLPSESAAPGAKVTFRAAKDLDAAARMERCVAVLQRLARRRAAVRRLRRRWRFAAPHAAAVAELYALARGGRGCCAGLLAVLRSAPPAPTAYELVAARAACAAAVVARVAAAFRCRRLVLPALRAARAAAAAAAAALLRRCAAGAAARARVARARRRRAARTLQRAGRAGAARRATTRRGELRGVAGRRWAALRMVVGGCRREGGGGCALWCLLPGVAAAVVTLQRLGRGRAARRWAAGAVRGARRGLCTVLCGLLLGQTQGDGGGGGGATGLRLACAAASEHAAVAFLQAAGRACRARRELAEAEAAEGCCAVEAAAAAAASADEAAALLARFFRRCAARREEAAASAARRQRRRDDAVTEARARVAAASAVQAAVRAAQARAERAARARRRAGEEEAAVAAAALVQEGLWLHGPGAAAVAAEREAWVRGTLLPQRKRGREEVEVRDAAAREIQRRYARHRQRRLELGERRGRAAAACGKPDGGGVGVLLRSAAGEGSWAAHCPALRLVEAAGGGGPLRRVAEAGGGPVGGGGLVLLAAEVVAAAAAAVRVEAEAAARGRVEAAEAACRALMLRLERRGGPVAVGRAATRIQTQARGGAARARVHGELDKTIGSLLETLGQGGGGGVRSED